MRALVAGGVCCCLGLVLSLAGCATPPTTLTQQDVDNNSSNCTGEEETTPQSNVYRVLAIDESGEESWEKHWEFVSQTGQQTGNNELQDYVPSNVKISDDDNSLSLVLERVHGSKYRSGKIVSRRTLLDWAPRGGAFEIEFSLPRSWKSSGDDNDAPFVPGLWPAIWLVPSSRVAPWPTGGEIDLMEMMHFWGDEGAAERGFTTLHFGPRRGVDAIFDGHWGLRLATFHWDLRREHQVIRFEWRRNQTSATWSLRQLVNNEVVWDQRLDRSSGVFVDFEKNKHFQEGAQAADFAPGAPGDPAVVFHRAFEDPAWSMRVICNLAFGGTPWAHDRQVDLRLERSVMTLSAFRVYRFADLFHGQ